MLDFEKLEDMDELEEDLADLNEMAREMMIISGYVLGAKNMVSESPMQIVELKYSENNAYGEMAENTGDVQKVNQYAFLDRPQPFPKKKLPH